MDDSKGTEQEFLKNYDPSKYDRPCVTADIVLFTVVDNKLHVLLIKRKNHPFKDKWAFPGGFLNVGKESLDDAAVRELHEETDVVCHRLRQLATFSDPDRDPRTHVISVAYTALIHESRLKYSHGDDAADAKLVSVYDTLYPRFPNHGPELKDMAFDHSKILMAALLRLKGRLDYTLDAFDLVKDQNDFTLGELREIYEAILNCKLDRANFNKKINNQFIKTGILAPTGNAVIGKNNRPAKTYRIAKRPAIDL